MKTSCKLQEFQLFPPSTANSTESSVSPNQTSLNSNRGYPLARDERTELPVGHNMSQVCVCDASELQARVILWLARRETEDKFRCQMGIRIGMEQMMQVQLFSHGFHGMSLQKSLSRFLQRRKDRIQSSMPYKQNIIRKFSGSRLGNKSS